MSSTFGISNFFKIRRPLNGVLDTWRFNLPLSLSNNGKGGWATAGTERGYPEPFGVLEPPAHSSGAFFWFFRGFGCFPAKTSGAPLNPPYNPLHPPQTPLHLPGPPCTPPPHPSSFLDNLDARTPLPPPQILDPEFLSLDRVLRGCVLS